MRLQHLDRMDVSASALAAYRQRMNVIAENLANAQTTRTEAGGPYRRQEVLFEAAQPRGAGALGNALNGSSPAGQQVRARVVTDERTPFTEVHDPGHPDADANGVVRYPNVNPAVEMVNLVLAARAYEANVTVLQSTKSMLKKALEI